MKAPDQNIFLTTHSSHQYSGLNVGSNRQSEWDATDTFVHD